MSGFRSFPAHLRATLVLGLPIIGSHLAQLGLTVTDTLMLGRYGLAELAAATIAGTAFFVVFILGAGFGQAILPLVAQAIGRGDEVQVRRDARMGMWLSLIYGVLTLPLFWFSGAWLGALGQRPEVAGLAQQFLRIVGFGMAPALLVMALKSCLAALGKAQVVLWVTLAAVGLNLAIGSTLIFGRYGAPEMGIRGAASATLGVQWASLLALGLYAGFAPDLRRFHLFARFWRPDWGVLVAVFLLGWPIGLTGLAEAGLFSSASVMMGWLGIVELAAHGIAMQAVSLAFMVHLGLSNAATVRTGKAMGEGDAAGLRDGAAVAVALSAGFAALVMALFLVLPHPILALFVDMTKPEAPQILSYGTMLLALAALFQLGDAMQVMALGLLRGIKDTRAPMWVAAVSYWGIGIPVSYGLGIAMGLGGIGIWLGVSIGLFAAAGSMMLRFWRLAPKTV